jgi:amino acid adenylation domain-containing protein/non-ribosomal peptide synthase protein (TIGR01720 family)
MTDKKLLNRLASLSPEQREALLKQLQKKKTQGSEPRKDGIQVYPRDHQHLPMSYAQQRLWFIDQLQSGSASYNISAALRLKGSLDVEALRMSFDEIVRRHEVLRTTFITEDGQGRQVINQHQRWELATISLEPLSREEQEEVIRARFKGDAHTSFDLINGPLLRTRLIRLSSTEHVMIVTMHHVIADGWSMGVFIREMALLYDAFTQDKQSPLTDLKIQYADYSLWQREWLSGERLERQLSYWKTRLDGVPVLELPTDFPRPPVHSYQGANLHFRLDVETSRALNELAKKQGVTLFMVLFAALQTLLHRYSGQDDVCVGTPIAGRVRPELEHLIGCFVNTLAIRSDLSGNPTFTSLLKQIQQNLTGAYDHQDIPFERLVDELGVAREMSHTPLFQVMFVLQNATSTSALSLPGLNIELLPEESETSKFDLTINMREEKGCLQGDFEYRTDLYSANSIQHQISHFQNLLKAVVANPAGGIDDFDYLSPQERQQILVEWNNTATDYERDSDVLDVFQQTVRLFPERVAVELGNQSLSYTQLDQRANHVALWLIEKGVRPGARVGLCAERSIETIAAILGILKAGASYVPLDPAYPQDRLHYMLDDTGAGIVIAHPHLTANLPVTPDNLIDLTRLQTESAPCPDPAVRVGPLAPAYVMYTSGSTGKPKGIEVVHRNIVRLVRNTNFMQLDESTSFLQYAPISFDAATLEIWGPLLNGGKIVVAPPGQLTPEELGAVIAKGNVNAAWLTAALFHVFAEYHAEQLKPIRQLLAGGDVLSPKLVRKVLQQFPGMTLINGYGPTENTTFTCCYPMYSPEDVRHTVPIGRPIANTKVYVLDRSLRPVPVGVPGELYTSGDGVANGYLNREELTADVFIQNPFCAGDDTRLYKTGDLVRYYPDGNIEYLGRIDQQVKIRGFRIELSEVEEAISRINTIREVAVIAREDVPRVKRLVAYFVPVEGAHPTAIELRAELKQSLPDYMVPSAFVAMDSLPVTANGKLDRRALPKPETDNEAALQRIPPRTEKEKILATIWCQVLNLQEVGIRDNFFELGGDSILSIQIISRAKLAGLHLTTKQIFENQTIEELAEVASEAETPVLAEQGMVVGDVLLSPIQQWFFEHDFAHEHHWNQSVLLDIRPEAKLTEQQIGKALTAVVQQHDALRLRFVRDGEQVRQFHQSGVSGDDHFVLHHIELEQDDPARIGQLITEHCARIQASLDLAQGPILAAGFFRLADGQRKLLLVIHHLVVDGVSWRILLDDFTQALQKVQQHDDPKLGMKTTSYQQWINALKDHVSSGALNEEMEHWRKLVWAEKPVLPLDDPDGSFTVADTVVLSHRLGEEQTQALLRDVNRAYRTDITDVLMTALARTFSDWSGNVETLLELEGHGREMFSDKIDLSRTVGWFTSVYPVRLRYENGQSLQDNLKSIKEQLRQIPNRGFGYGALRYLGTDEQRDELAQAPQADLVFNYLGQFDSIIENNPWFTVAAEERGLEHSLNSEDPHRLSINSHIVDGRLQVDWIYSEKVFKPQTIERLATQYLRALEQVIHHCTQPDVFGYTPSDFPLTRLDQQQIDRLVGKQRGIVSIYPLSPMQEGMLFHSLFDNDAGVYFEQLSVEVIGNVDRDLLKQAWIQVVNRHPALRSAFVWQDLDRPLQIVYNRIEMEVNEFDWRNIDPAQEQHRLNVWLEKDRQRGFDFDKPGLMRLAWVDLPGHRSRLIWSFHHIVLDGWSLPLVMGEVFQTYGALVKGVQLQLPAAGSYEDFIAYLERSDKGDALQFWKLYLAGFEAATPLPNKKQRNHQQDKVFAEHHLRLDDALTSRLQTFAREQHVTLNTVIQAAWGVLLARYSGEKDVVFGTTVSGRPAELANVEQIVGLFINTLPLRLQIDDDTTIAPLLQRMQEDQLDLRRYEFTPLVDIHRHSDVPGDQALFDSILVFENYPVGEAVHSADELLDIGHITTIEHTNFPITLIVEPSDRLLIKLSYDATLFESSAIQRTLLHLQRVIQGVLSQPDVPLWRLPILGEEERNRILHEWNPEPANYPRNLCLHQVFERQVKAHPDRVALVSGHTEISYDELNRRANRLARLLLESGVKDQDFVTVALDRSIDMIVSILAILKAGCAYVPVDPEYPAERIGFMLEDTKAPVMISVSHHIERLSPIMAESSPQSRLIVLDRDAELIAAKSGENVRLAVRETPQRHAYVVYTSGSTGKPKGILVNQLGVIRLVLDTNYFRLEDDDRVAHCSNVSFDASVYEMWAPLLNGTTMVLYSKDMLITPDAFYEELLRTRTNVIFITTALFNAFAAARPEIFSAMKYVMFGGEACDPNQVRYVLREFKPRHLLHVYGPSENTTFSTWYEVEHVSDWATTVPIGRSISGSTAFILDRHLQPVSVGVTGEIYVGGDGLAIGYLNDPEKTAAAFIANPLVSKAEDRLYRTGDLARYTEDGQIEILGRADDQVKIRGFRIELGEVEASLTRLEAVNEAVVVVKQDQHRQKRLVAYVRVNARVDSSFIRREAAKVLPKHMLPSAFVVMEQFPLTPNGKINKRALPEPELDSSSTQHYVAPRNEKETTLVHIWEQVLKADTVGVHDNFFELGGDSILSIQIISRAKKAGLHLTAKQIFEFQTIAELAEAAQELQDIILAEQGQEEGVAPLTPVQHWFFDQNIADIHHFNQSLLLTLDKRVSVEQVKTAWEAILLQHDALRLRYNRLESGAWQQSFRPSEHAETLLGEVFDVVNLSGLPVALRGEQITQLAGQVQTELNMSKGPLVRVIYFDMGRDHPARLLMVIHHLVVDVFSWRILLEDLQIGLQQAAKDERIELGNKTTSYRQWGEALIQLANSEQLDADFDYWRQRAVIRPPRLPQDNHGKNQVASVKVIERKLDSAQTRRLLTETSRCYRTEINDLLLTALARSISGWTGSDSVLFDLEGHGREHVADMIDVSRTVGWFTSIYPVVLGIDTQVDLGAQIRSVKEQLRAIPRKGMSYGVLRYLSEQPERRNTLSALAHSQISFNYLGQLDQVVAGDGLLSQATESPGEEIAPAGMRAYLLEISGRVQNGELVLAVRYSHAIHDQATIERLINQLVQEIGTIIEHCSDLSHAAYTPSDFPLARLTQEQLDTLLPKKGVEAVYPCSPVQEGMLFHSLYEPGSWVYFDQVIVPITGAVNEAALFDAWRAVIARHQILRTGFLWDGVQQPLQVVMEQIDLDVQRYDWSRLPADQAQEKFQRYLVDDRNLGFGFKRPGVLRLSWVAMPGNEHRLVWSFHHILLDGWSLPIVFGELFSAYDAFNAGREWTPPPAPRYQDFIGWHVRQDRNKAQTFWKKYLEGFSAATPIPVKNSAALVAQKGRAGDSASRYREAQTAVAGQLLEGLQSLAKQHRMTLNHIMQGVWAALLERYSGESDVLFGTTVSGRPADLAGIENMVGLFINTLPMRLRVDKHAPFIDWLQGQQDAQGDLKFYEYSSLVDVQKASALPAKQAMFESILVFENYPIDETLEQTQATLRIGEVDAFQQTNFPLTLIIIPGRELLLRFSYDSHLFEPVVIERMLGHIQQMLVAIHGNPGILIHQLPLLTEREQDQLVDNWNRTERLFASDSTLMELFEQKVQQYPQQIACEFGDQRVSYERLNCKANQLARLLIANGVKPTNPVAICFDRSLAMVEGMLAILKAGGVYVPIDPSYPQERVQHMMDDTRAPVLLTSREYSERFAYLAETGVTRVLEWETLSSGLQSQPDSNPGIRLPKGSRSLAYIIYTSGSTGKPKGVCVPQVAVSRLVLNTDYVQLQPGHRMGHASNVSFDAATFEFWGAFLNGGTLVGIDKETTLNPDAFAHIIKQRKIDVLFVTTALFNVLSKQTPDVFSQLQYLLFGGEACDPNQVRAVLNQAGGPAHLLHVYGPTENTTFSTWYEVKDVLPGSTTVPIGYPIANSTLYVLDEQLRPVPIGVPGEIYVGGIGVADGYLNRPELTREVFLTDPFNASRRMYKTGDLGRLLESGALEILGRMDDQVKIRGFRIELGEVETAVNQLPGIRETSVVVRSDASGNKQLVAYCEKVPEQEMLPVAELKAKLKQFLPDYMVPSAIVLLDHLPITPNGKVDKRALPAPEAEDYASNAYVAPRNPTEDALAAIWCEVLGVAQVGAYDDFFELGGHSLLITKVSTRIKQQLGVELPLRTLFEVPTVAALAEIICAVSFVPAADAVADEGEEEFEEGSL